MIDQSVIQKPTSNTESIKKQSKTIFEEKKEIISYENVALNWKLIVAQKKIKLDSASFLGKKCTLIGRPINKGTSGKSSNRKYK